MIIATSLCPAQGQLQAEQQKSVELSVSLGEAGRISAIVGWQMLDGENDIKMMVNHGKLLDVGQLDDFETKPSANFGFVT